MRALGVLAALAAWLAGALALAQETTQHTLWEAPKVGRWTVKAMRSGLSGPAQCVMSNIGDGSGVAYAIQPGDVQRLVVQNRQWRIAPGATSAMQLQVDRFTTWEVMARRSLNAADTVFVDARFDAAARRLLEQMREGDWLHITFPSGERYRVSLEGSKFAGGFLLECYNRFSKAAR